MKNNHLKFVTGLLSGLFTATMLVLAYHHYNKWYFAFIALVPMVVAGLLFFMLFRGKITRLEKGKIAE